MEAINFEGDCVMKITECEEIMPSSLESILKDFLVFLKSRKMNESFRCNYIRDIIKLGANSKRPCMDLNNMPVALSVVHKLVMYLAEDLLLSLEDELFCADAIIGLLSMFTDKYALNIIQDCFHLQDDSRNILDLTIGDDVNCTFVVAHPLKFKLCIARAILQNRSFLTAPVLCSMTEPIVIACYQYSHLTTLGLRVLNMWLSHWNKMNYCLDDIACQTIYCVIASNWQNPLAGVRKEIYKSFSSLLEVSCQKTKFTPESILQHVLKNLSWKMKSKYFYLTILMPKLGVEKVLEDNPSIVFALIETLGTHHICYSGADLYRVCIREFPDKESWCKWFLDPVMDLMSSQNEKQLVLQNFLSRWLTPTLRCFPALNQNLLDRLVLLHRSGVKVDLPLSALLHQSRKEGYVTDLWPVYSFIERFLQSSDEETRKHAFAAVCKRTKKTAIPLSEEFEAVKNFLVENVNIDSGPFRQSMVDSFVHFLERLLESGEKYVPEARTNCNHEQLMPILTFLEWLHAFLMDNLECGGNYQRKVTSLQLFLEVLKYFGPGQVKENHPSNSFYLFAKGLNIWRFDSENSWHCVLHCILDPSDDIQKTASVILSNHLKLLDENGAENRAKYILKTSSTLCNSSLFYEVESGVVLVKLIAQFIQEKPRLSCIIPQCSNEENPLTYEDILPEIFTDLTIKHELSLREQVEYLLETEKCNTIKNIENSTGEQKAFLKDSEEPSALQFYVQYRLKEAYSQWDTVQADLFKAIKSGKPLLGALAALEPLVPHFRERDITRALCLTTASSDHFLSLLAPTQSSGDAFSPSFAEMTQAVEQLIPEALESDGGNTSQLSASHQLVLSCLWLSLKACCSLSALLLCHKEASGTHALHCLALVQKVLLRCRHKGTIESAGTALGNMVRHITSSQESRQCITSTSNKSEKLCDVLEKMLLQVLSSILVYSPKTSITRRSAGVGILVHRIVAMDVRPDKPLLTVCLRHLCRVVEDPPLLPEGISAESCDLPQANALHLLMRLAQEASLRQQMAPFASTVALLCFGAFADKAWTVQNAALQLFGALVPLLVGEKKVADDDEQSFGCLTAEEFLTHHPTLGRFLVDALRAAADAAEADAADSAARLLARKVAAATAAASARAAHIAGTAASIAGTPASIAGTPASIAGTAASIAGTSTPWRDYKESASAAGTIPPVTGDLPKSTWCTADTTTSIFPNGYKSSAAFPVNASSSVTSSSHAVRDFPKSSSCSADLSTSFSPLSSPDAFPTTSFTSKNEFSTLPQKADSSSTPTRTMLPKSSSDYSVFPKPASASSKSPLNAASTSGCNPSTSTSDSNHRQSSLARRVAAATISASAATISASLAVGARVFRGSTPPAAASSASAPKPGSTAVAFKASSADVVFFAEPEEACSINSFAATKSSGPDQMKLPQDAAPIHYPILNSTASSKTTSNGSVPHKMSDSVSTKLPEEDSVTNYTKSPQNISNKSASNSKDCSTSFSHVVVGSSNTFRNTETLPSAHKPIHTGHSPCENSKSFEELPQSFYETSLSKNVVPVLCLLSKLTLGDGWSTINMTSDVVEIRHCFQALMKCSDLTVRKLAAKAYSRFLLPEELFVSALELITEIQGDQMAKSVFIKTENEVHGLLLCIQYIINRLSEEGDNAKTFYILLERFVTIGLFEGSWVNRCLEVEIILKLEKLRGMSVSKQDCVKLVSDALMQIKMCRSTEVGVWSWAMQCVRYASEMCKADEVCYLWTMIYATNWPELAECFLSGVCKHVDGNLSRGKLLLVVMSSIFETQCNDGSLMCAIYRTVLDLVAVERIPFTPLMFVKMFKVATKANGLQSWAIALPLACEIFSLHLEGLLNLESQDTVFLEMVAQEVRDRSLPESCDAECRALAARAFVALYRMLPRLRWLLDKCKKMHCYILIVYVLLDSGVAFLQDEDSEVRKEAAKFIFPERNSYVCLLSLLSVENLSTLLSSFYIVRYYESRLFDFDTYDEILQIIEFKNDSLISVSPFEQGTSNIYAEEVRVLTLMSDAFICILQNNPSWPLNLITLPDSGKLTNLVTSLIPQWNTSSKGMDMKILQTKLKALARISEIVSPLKAEEYKAMVDFIALYKES